MGRQPARIFEPGAWRGQPLRAVLIGSDSEVKVWEQLLKVKHRQTMTYSDMAAHIPKPRAAPAVGCNPICFMVVPRHRVLGSSGMQ